MKSIYNKRKYEVSILLSFLILQIFSGFLFTNINLENSAINNQELEVTNLDLKNSDLLPLDLVSPENRTYLEPDEGYYPATYGFDYQKFKVRGTDIDFVDWVDDPYTFVEIENVAEGHSRFISINQAHGWGEIYNNFTDQTAGTIEFWIRTDLPSDECVITLKDDDLNIIAIKWDSYYFSWRDQDTVWHNVKRVEDTLWHHIRIDFFSDSTFNWYLDGEEFVYREKVFNNMIDGIDRFDLKEYGIGIVYLDAIGYSWDPYYNVGDNLMEGFFISFTSNQELNWTAFSLDNKMKRAIMGNTVIPLPDEGKHNIQLFGTDTDGNTYQSEKRYFEVYLPLELLTPQSKDYPYMAGYYPATYSFENGSIPSDWIDLSSGGCTSTIVESYNEHKNVLKLTDNDGNNAHVEKDFTGQSSGTIEFWLLTKNTNYRTYMVFRDSDGQIAYYLAVHDSYLKIWYDNDPIISINVPIQEDQWYHIKTSFDCVSKHASVWINGILALDNGEFYADVSLIEKFQLYTNNNEYNYISYFDAIGFSWDPNYNVGDNAYEGLFVSYTNRTNLKWVGYSFDGQEVVRDSLNRTFPIPSIGQHSLQLLGKDYSNHIYQSHLVQFYIEPIDILTPENDTYVDPFSGYYPATFGFENTASRFPPIFWGTQFDANCYAEVIDEYSGHKKVLKFYDNNNNGFAAIGQNVGSQESGTIEFWVNPNYVGTDGQFFLYLYSSGDIFLQLGVYDNKISYAGREWVNVYGFQLLLQVIKEFDISPPIKSWHHIRISFTPNAYTLFVDGVEVDTLSSWVNTGPITDVIFNTSVDGGVEPFDIYIDAIGYSWDPNYNIGDNRKEGMIIRYKHHPSLESFSYSLNNQAEKPISDKILIPMPQYGDHQVQIYGTDSKGIRYESKVRRFRYSPIEIIAPKNETYLDPLKGHYSATYGYEEVPLQTLPSYCTYDVAGTSPDGPTSYARVIDSKTDSSGRIHKNVLELCDWSKYSWNWVHSFFTSSGSELARDCTIEFYILLENKGGYFYHSYGGIKGNLGNIALFEWDSRGSYSSPQIRYHNSNGEYFSGVYQEWDKWYRYSIDISCDGGYAGLGVSQYRFRIYDETGELVYKSSDMGIVDPHPTGGPDRCFLQSSETQNKVYHYLDALGITGLQDNYEIGDNINEGLLLEYNLRIGLDWMGYSLDGQPIKYIRGKATIPLPFVGTHIIQLIGGKSSDIYKSKQISFTVREAPNVFQYSFSNSTLDYSLLEEKPYWNITWGGALDETCQALATDSNGNIYVGGHRETVSNKLDLILRKYDPSGNLIWGKQFGGSEDDRCFAITLDSVGNVYIAGDTRSYPAEYEPNEEDLIIVKYDQNGNYKWYRTWEGGPSTDTCHSLAVDSMDNIYCGVETYTSPSHTTDAGLLKYDSSGNLLWARTWGGSNLQVFMAISIDSHDNIYCCGETYTGTHDLLLIKYNSTGDLQWELTWGDPDEMESGHGIAIDSNDNIYLQGISWHTEMIMTSPGHYESRPFNNILLVKFNKSGDYQWDTLWDGGLDERCFSMTIDSTDNILMGAYTNSYGEGNYDMLLLKYNNLGNLILNTTWGGAKDDICYAIAKDRFNNVYLGGYTTSFGVQGEDLCLVKFSQGFKTNISFSVKVHHELLGSESKIQFKFSNFINVKSGNVLYLEIPNTGTYYSINLPISPTPIDLDIEVPVDLAKFQIETSANAKAYDLNLEIYSLYDCQLELDSANLCLEDVFGLKGLILFNEYSGYIDFGLDVGTIGDTDWICNKVEIFMPKHNILKRYYFMDVYYDQFWSFDRIEFSTGPKSYVLNLDYNLDPTNHILEISDSDLNDNDNVTKALNPYTYRIYYDKKQLNLDLYIQNPSLELGHEIIQITQDDYNDYSLYCKIYDPDPFFGKSSVPYFMGVAHFEPLIEYTVGEFTRQDTISTEGLSIDPFTWNLDAGQYDYHAQLINILETVYRTAIINTTLLDYYEQLYFDIDYDTLTTYTKQSLDFGINLKNPDDDIIVENINVYPEQGGWDNHDNVSLSIDTFSNYSGTIYHFETGEPSPSPYLNNGDPAISLLNELSYPYGSIIITPEIIQFDPVTKHSEQFIEVHFVLDLTDIFELYNFGPDDLSALNATVFGSSFIDSVQQLADIESYYGKVEIFNMAFDEFQPLLDDNIFLETLEYGNLNNPLKLDDLEDYKLSFTYDDNISQFIDAQNRITIRFISYFEGNISSPDTYISSFGQSNSVLGALIDYLKFDLVWWKETPEFSIDVKPIPLITPDVYRFEGIMPGNYNLQFEFDNPKTHYLYNSADLIVEVLRRPVNVSLAVPSEAYSTDIIEIQAEVNELLNQGIPSVDALVRFHTSHQNLDIILGEALTDVNGIAKLEVTNLPLGANEIWAETIPNQGRYQRPYILKNFEHDYWALNSSEMYPLNIKLSQSKLELKSLAPGVNNVTVGEHFYLYTKLIDTHTQLDVYNEPIEIHIDSVFYGVFDSFTPILVEFTEPGEHIVEAIFKGTPYLNRSSTAAMFSATRLSLSFTEIFPEKDLYVAGDSINISAFAYDLTTQSPVENLEVSLYTNRSMLLGTGNTEQDGIIVFTVTILEEWVGKEVTFYAINTPKTGLYLQHYTYNISVEVRRFNCSIITSVNESQFFVNEDYEFSFRLFNLDKNVYVDNQIIDVTLFKGIDILQNFEVISSSSNFKIFTFASAGVYELSSIHYESELYMLCHDSFTFEVQKRPTYISLNMSDKQLVPGNEFSFSLELFDALNNQSILDEYLSVYEYIYENDTLVASKEPFIINTLDSNTFRWTPLRSAKFEFNFVYDDLINQNLSYQSSNLSILLEVFKRQVRIDTITNGTEFKIEDFVQITSTFLDLNSTFLDPVNDLTVHYLIYEGDNLLYDQNHTTDEYGLISFNWMIPAEMVNKNLTILVLSAKTNFYDWNYFKLNISTRPLQTSFNIKTHPNPHGFVNENIVFDLILQDNRGRNILGTVSYEIVCSENLYHEFGTMDLSVSSSLTKSFSESGRYIFKFSFEGSEIYSPVESEIVYFIDLYPSLLEAINFPKFVYSTQQQLNLLYRLTNVITNEPIQNCLIKLYYVDFDLSELIPLNVEGTTDSNGEITFTITLPNDYQYESVIIVAESEETTLHESTSNNLEIIVTDTPTFINLNSPTDIFVHYIDDELDITVELFDDFGTPLVSELLYINVLSPDTSKSFSLYCGETFTLNFTQLGIYEITVEYRGSSQYLPSNVEVTYSASPVPTALGFINEIPSLLYTDQVLHLEARLKNNLTHDPISGESIKFYIASDTSTFLIYEGITDNSGIVEYDWVIEESLINKEIIGFAEYEYKYYYENSSTSKFSILISKYEIFVSPLQIPDLLTPNFEETLKVEVFRNTGEKAANCHLQLYVQYPNGPQILISEGITDANGLYSLMWLPNRQVFDFDQVELKIYIVEDLYYYGGLKFSEEISVDKISTQISIDLDNIFILPDDTITIEFNLKNAFNEVLFGEFLFVEIDNILYKSDFFVEIGVNDTYQLVVPNYGLFEVRAFYYGNDRHYPSDNSTVFYSEKLKLDIDLQTLETLDKIKGQNYTLIANLSTIDARIPLEGVEIYFFFVKAHQEPIFLGTNFTNELGFTSFYWDTSNHPSNASSGALYAEVYESDYYLYAKSNPLYIDVQNVHTFIELDTFTSSFRINVQYRINLTLYDEYLFELYGQEITVEVFSPKGNKLVNSYSLMTNESTHIYFTPTELGNYKFEVSYEGTDLYKTSSLVEHFKCIEKEPTNIQIIIPENIVPGQPYTVIINLYNSTGDLVDGEYIEVKILRDDTDYETLEIITGVNSSFEYVFPVADEYTIKATYNGSVKYEGCKTIEHAHILVPIELDFWGTFFFAVLPAIVITPSLKFTKAKKWKKRKKIFAAICFSIIILFSSYAGIAMVCSEIETTGLIKDVNVDSSYNPLTAYYTNQKTMNEIFDYGLSNFGNINPQIIPNQENDSMPYDIIDQDATVVPPEADHKPPYIQISNIGDENVLSGVTTIEAKAFDMETNVKSVVFKLLEEGFSIISEGFFTYNQTLDLYTLNLDTTQFEDGKYDILAIAYDENDNNNTDTVSINFLNHPEVSPVTPEETTTIVELTDYLNVSFMALAEGIYNIQIKDSNYKTVYSTTGKISSEETKSVEIPIDPLYFNPKDYVILISISAYNVLGILKTETQESYIKVVKESVLLELDVVENENIRTNEFITLRARLVECDLEVSQDGEYIDNGIRTPISGQKLTYIMADLDNHQFLGSRVSDHNGYTTITYNCSLLKGFHSFNVSYKGSNIYKPLEVNKVFENKGKRTNILLSYVDTPIPYNSIGTVEVYLLSKNYPISNNSLYFNISNSHSNFYLGMAETNEAGKATLTFPCNHLPGVYDIIAYFDGNSNFAENETVFYDKLEIVKEDSVIQIITGHGEDITCPLNYETELVAKLITDIKGIGIEGVNLIFELILDGEHTLLGSASTDSNGVASFTFKPIDSNILPNEIENKYILNVFIEDHPLYKSSSAHVYLDVTKDNPLITIEGTTINYQEGFSINATLTDSSLNPLIDRWLDFYIINPITENIEFSGTAITNLNGIATFTVAPYAFDLYGSFDIAVRFGETSIESYTYQRFENALTILRCETLITITGSTEQIPTESLNVRILLTDYNRRAIAGQQLFLECYKESGQINLLGDDLYVLTDINGIAFFSLPLLLPDKFVLKVFYRSQSDDSPLNDGYLESSASYNFKIVRIPAGLAIEELNKPRIMRGETLEFTVIAQAKQAVNYLIPARLYVDGVNFDHVDILQGTFNILLGKAELFYKIPLGPSFQAGIYNFTIEIQPGTFFEGSITFSIDLVERTSLSIEYIILNTKANGKHYVNESEIIKFTLLDEDKSPLPHFIDYQIINKGVDFGTLNINEMGIYLLENVPSSYGIQFCYAKYRGTRFFALSEDKISVRILKRPLVLDFISYTHDNPERADKPFLGHRGDTLTVITRVKDYLDDVYLRGKKVEFAYDNNFIGISKTSSQGGYAIFSVPLSQATSLIQEGVYSLSVRIKETEIFKSAEDTNERELVIYEIGHFECSIGTFTTEGMNYLINSEINFFDEDGIVVNDYEFTVMIINKKSNSVLSSFKAKSGIVPLTVSEGGYFKILIRMKKGIDEDKNVVKIVNLLYREMRIVAVQLDTGYKVIDPEIPYVEIPVFSEVVTKLLWQALKWKAHIATVLILVGLFAIFGKKTERFTWSVIIKFIIYLLVLKLTKLDDIFLEFVLKLQLAGFLYFISNTLKGENWLYNCIVFLITQVAAIGISYYLKARREAFSPASMAELKKGWKQYWIILLEFGLLIFYGFLIGFETALKDIFNLFFGLGNAIFGALTAFVNWLWNQKRKYQGVIEKTPRSLIVQTIYAIIIFEVVGVIIDLFFPPIGGLFGLLWEIFRITLKVTITLLALAYITTVSLPLQALYSSFIIKMVEYFIEKVFNYVTSAFFTTLSLPYIDPESGSKEASP